MENNVYTELGKNIIAVLPKNWERVCLYAQISTDSCEFFFHVKIGDKYIYCFDLEKSYGISRKELREKFKELHGLLSPDQKEKNWYVLTFILNSDGKFSVEYEYTDYSENSLDYQRIWKEKYLK